MKKSTSTKSSSSRDTFENYDPSVTVRPSSGSDPLIPYSPDLVIQAVQQSGLSEVEIAEKANRAFSWQWVYSLEAGDYPRAALHLNLNTMLTFCATRNPAPKVALGWVRPTLHCKSSLHQKSFR